MKKPLFCLLDLSQHRVLVAGGGRAAAIKLKALKAAGARLRLVAPQACDGAQRLLRNWPNAAWLKREVRAADLLGCHMVVAATGHRGVDAGLSALAKEKGLWVLNAQDPALGNWAMAASAQAGLLRVGVSTHGASPKLAKVLAQNIATALKQSGFPKQVQEAAKLRKQAQSTR
jgi:uroporphyrin-III C-methyltransferase/precorrin-2 dehydrogenase/sirohydrochlorin ferrochelatase